jgi:hypothetical protein
MQSTVCRDGIGGFVLSVIAPSSSLSSRFLVCGFEEAVGLRERRHDRTLQVIVPDFLGGVSGAVHVEGQDILLLVLKVGAREQEFEALVERVLVDVKDVVVNQHSGVTDLGEIVQQQRNVVDEDLFPLDAVAAVIVYAQDDVDNLLGRGRPDIEGRRPIALDKLMYVEDRALDGLQAIPGGSNAPLEPQRLGFLVRALLLLVDGELVVAANERLELAELIVLDLIGCVGLAEIL